MTKTKSNYITSVHTYTCPTYKALCIHRVAWVVAIYLGLRFFNNSCFYVLLFEGVFGILCLGDCILQSCYRLVVLILGDWILGPSNLVLICHLARKIKRLPQERNHDAHIPTATNAAKTNIFYFNLNLLAPAQYGESAFQPQLYPVTLSGLFEERANSTTQVAADRRTHVKTASHKLTQV